MGFVVVHLQMKEQVEESNNHKGKSKKKKNREWVQKWDDICRKMWEDYNAME